MILVVFMVLFKNPLGERERERGKEQQWLCNSEALRPSPSTRGGLCWQRPQGHPGLSIAFQRNNSGISVVAHTWGIDPALQVVATCWVDGGGGGLPTF